VKKQSWQQWARVCAADPSSPSLLKKGSLAALTGTDIRVLDAFVPCLSLYAHTGDEHVLGAAQIVLDEMQPHTLWIAKELIAFVLDWPDRERLWPRVSAVSP
jgi:hypothetical protein